MKHTFLITEDYFRSLDFNQALQTVVTDDDATVEVIEVGCGKTATIQRYQRTELGGDDRNNLHNHPLGLVHILRRTESLYYLQALQGLGLTLLTGVIVGTVAQFVRDRVEVKVSQQVADSLGTHFGNKLVRIVIGQ